jgi:hypothetical protein
MSNSPRGTALVYEGSMIHRNAKNGLVCLTDMWKAEGSPANKEPLAWIRLEATQELLKHLCDQTGTVPVWSEWKRGKRETKKVVTQVPGFLEPKRGGVAPGTYASSQFAIDYAQILSVDFHQWALNALVERIEEESDPEKALSRGYERAVKTWKQQGHSDENIEVLAQCVIVRKDLTSTLSQHGAVDKKTLPNWIKSEGMAYGFITNLIYKPLIGDKAADYRKKHNLPKDANVRDHLAKTEKMVQRAAIMLAETMARENIREENRYGFSLCRTACEQAGKKVARIFE